MKSEREAYSSVYSVDEVYWGIPSRSHETQRLWYRCSRRWVPDSCIHGLSLPKASRLRYSWIVVLVAPISVSGRMKCTSHMSKTRTTRSSPVVRIQVASDVLRVSLESQHPTSGGTNHLALRKKKPGSVFVKSLTRNCVAAVGLCQLYSGAFSHAASSRVSDSMSGLQAPLRARTVRMRFVYMLRLSAL